MVELLEDELAYRALVYSILVFNGGLLSGWLVGVLTGSEEDSTAVLVGVLVVILFAIAVAVLMFRRLRARYELSFYLSGMKQVAPQPAGNVVQKIPQGEVLSLDAPKGDDAMVALPGVAAADADVIHVTMDGPSAHLVQEAEAEIRHVLEEGRPEDIDSVIHKHTRLVKYINMDLLWASELLQLRLSAAAIAVERARQAAEAAEVRSLSLAGPQAEDPALAAAAASLTQDVTSSAIVVAKSYPDIEAKQGEKLQYLGEVVHETQAQLRTELLAKQELVKKVEGLQDTISKLESLQMVNVQERELLRSQNSQLQKDLQHVQHSLHVAKEELRAIARDRYALVGETNKLGYIAPYVGVRVAEATSEAVLGALQDAAAGRAVAARVAEALGAALGLSVYLAQFPLFSSGEGDHGELPAHQLVYTAASASEQALLTQVLPREACSLSYEAVVKRKVVVVPSVEKNIRVHFWNGRAAQTGSLMLVPIEDHRTNRVLGLVGVDTLRRDVKELVEEERQVVEKAAQRIALALVRAREAQERSNFAVLQAAQAATEGWAGAVERRVGLLAMKARLEAVLAPGSPETAACAAEIETYQGPPKPIICICSALLVLLSGEGGVVEEMETRFGPALVPPSDDGLLKLWREVVRPGLGAMCAELPTMMAAADFRAPTAGSQRVFLHVEAMLRGVSVTRDSLNGSNIVLYFYPWLMAVLGIYKLVQVPVGDAMVTSSGPDYEEGDLSASSQKVLEVVQKRAEMLREAV